MPYRYGKSVVYRLGERGSGLHAIGLVQDFQKLRVKCIVTGTMFEDPDFPAENSSLYYSRTPTRPIKWKRPKEIVNDPRLFIEGISRFDVKQGELGNCWLIAAVANLTLHRTLFHQVVPDDQGFQYKYAGIFHFRFWQYGHWVDVVIDDRLPTLYGKLLFLHSSKHNEFWSALLEKAYAKLHGSYEALKEGTTCEAMEDFTGGITEVYELNNPPPHLYSIMLKAHEHASLLGCAIEPDPDVFEAQTPEGLVKGHAYSITMVKYIQSVTSGRPTNIPLIRLRNPWGNDKEWNGPWSDKSPEWKRIPEKEKEKIGLSFEADGEFWMSYTDFEKHFTHLEICNLDPASMEEILVGQGKKRWEMSMFEGAWVKGITAGGCRNYLETFHRNPQYRISPDHDEDDNKSTVVIALMQKNRRSQRKMGKAVLTIGFVLYYLEDPDDLPKPLGLDFFKYNRTVARSPSFINLREVCCRFKLPPGVYCIVPSTFTPNEEGEFVLRVFSENKTYMRENDEAVGVEDVDDTFFIVPHLEDQKGEDRAREFFRKIAGEEMEIQWIELKKILDYALRNELPKEGLSKDICRSMVAMLDVDGSGRLGYEEFIALWRDIRVWKNNFKLYDRESNGTLSASELRQALHSVGYKLNNQILNMLVHRYGNSNEAITFDDFLMCAVKLKAMIELFLERDTDSTGYATFTIEEWIKKTVYA